MLPSQALLSDSRLGLAFSSVGLVYYLSSVPDPLPQEMRLTEYAAFSESWSNFLLRILNQVEIFVIDTYQDGLLTYRFSQELVHFLFVSADFPRR